MTLPFRRRHHDAEAGHDRARQLWSIGMIEPLDERDASWLDAHLEGCSECRLERQAQLEDRSLLRSLRDQPIEPPRDLWARTAAAIEREAARQSRGGLGLPVPNLVPARARLPLGVLSGVLVVLVVVAVSVAPLTTPQTATGSPSGGVAVVTPEPGSSPLVVAAADVTYVQESTDGSIRIIHAPVDKVCPTEKSGCAPLEQQTQSSPLDLGAPPQALVISPGRDQLVVAAGKDGSHAGSVIVVPVPTPVASGTPEASASATASPTQGATSTPASSSPSTAPPTPAGTAEPTPIPTPQGAHSILEGVVLVGEARYSPDGRWLAFSAEPIDGKTGPDLYVWNGTDATATPVTTDHATYFSSWYGDQILASRFTFTMPSIAPDPSASPGASLAPAVVEAMPFSFIFDPATGQTQPLAKPDVWLPTVDQSKRFVTYWQGSLLLGPDLTSVRLGIGHLVLDGWLQPLGQPGPNASGGPVSASREPEATPPTPTTGASGSAGGPLPTAAPPVGPAGTPIELVAGPITVFDARFDPSGTHLAVWVADASDPTASVGSLQLIVLDRDHGRLDPRPSPLPSVRALKGVSIDEGRVAWVTPPGQDGNQSTVQVLAWSKDDFGQVETDPGMHLTIVR